MINEYILMTEARVRARHFEERWLERETRRLAVRRLRDRRRVDRAVATALAHGFEPAELAAELDPKLRSAQVT